MTTYFDSSAIVPLLVDEPSSPRCERTWNEARELTTSTLSYVEVRTALAQAHRLQRLSDRAYQQAIYGFEQLWEEITPIAPVERLLRHAAALGSQQALRGYDAVHCATALAAASDHFAAITGDAALLRAWSNLGIITIDANG